MCLPGGLEDPPGHHQGKLEAPLVGIAPSPARRGTGPLAGGDAGGPGTVGQVAVSGNTSPWLASFYAYQSRWAVSPRRFKAFSAAEADGAEGGDELVWPRHGFFDTRAATGRHLAGLVGSWAQRA